MRRSLARLSVIGLSSVLVSTTWALDGASLAVRSNGFNSGASWILQQNGYVGTYLDVATPGDVTVSVNAVGQQSGGVDPLMNLVLADESASFSVPAAGGMYEHTFHLPAGKYFLRTEFANDPGRTGRQLTVQQLNVSGATFSNENTDANALAEANTYIENYRQGPARVALLGATPGSTVHVKLTNHAFNFGANMPGSGGNTYLGNAQFTNFFVDHFNAAVPSNGGKWSVNEPFDQFIDMSYADAIRSFAENNGLRLRMHTLAWGTQNPGFIQNLVDNAADGSTSAKNSLRTQLSQRIDYYVGDGDDDQNDGDRAQRYFAVDVLNEHVHQGQYFDAFTPAELADLFNEVKQAADAAGGPDVGLFLNEYNVLQNGDDDYGNWYRAGADDIVNAGGHVDGLGIQYYARSSFSQPHSAARINQVLQNLSVGGFDLTLTEYGVQGCCATESEAADILEDTMRMMFGTPQADGFFHWGFWAGGTDPNLQGAGVLVDQDFNLTESGLRRQALMDEWDTDLVLSVRPDGTIDYTGFYGDYDISIGGNTFSLNLTKGVSDYALIVGPPSADFDFDGDVDGQDLLIWQRNYLTTNPSFEQGDANYDGKVNADDLAIWQTQFGTSSVSSAAPVPEPRGLTLLAFAAAFFLNRNQPPSGDV